MRILRTLRTAFRALRRNPMRAGLTALGIIIGVAAVIAMMEIGQGSSSAIQKTIASMGANSLMVFPGAAASGGISFGGGSVMTLSPGDCDAIQQEATASRWAAPVVRARCQVVYGNRNWVPNTINGTTPAFLEIREWTDLAEGEPFTDRDVRNASKVCVIGQTLVRELFQGESPVGKEIRVKNVTFRVVGVLASKGANMMGMDQDDILLAPWTTIKYRVVGSSVTNVNQSTETSSTTVNTLSQLYPGTSGICTRSRPTCNRPTRRCRSGLRTLTRSWCRPRAPKPSPWPSARSPTFCMSGTGSARASRTTSPSAT